MSLENVFIPYGSGWSSPFCRWQGSLASQHAIELAAETTVAALEARKISAEVFDSLVLGISVPQKASFYGAPWLAGLIGAPSITGPTIAQACATSARMVAAAALEIETGQRACSLLVACDRTSNGPHIYYPNPKGPGGMGSAENPVWDNFGKDPWAGGAMIQTAETVAAAAGITREQQDEVALLRSQQYTDALADDRAFQRAWMVPVALKKGRKVIGTVDADEGVFPSTAEGLARLRPMMPEGTVTFGSQTHPADGNAGLVVCGRERAEGLSSDRGVTIQVLSYGEARVGKGLMPTAPVPAALDALGRCDLGIEDCDAIKTHNPFALNDVYFCRELGLDPAAVNRFGSPLVWGHPQSPTGLRAIIELIEELRLRGGGIGLFSGCAAGDTAMALVLKVA